MLHTGVARALLRRIERLHATALVASCPEPPATGWEPLPAEDSRAACVVGDAVEAVWAGNRKREPATIEGHEPGPGGGEYVVGWADGDASHRLVAARQVFKGGNPCARPLCHWAVGVAAAAARRWDEVLMDLSGQHDWSEYTLYWAEACAAGLTAARHAPHRPGRRLYDGSAGAFEHGKFDGLDVNKLFGPEGDVLFGVLQSTAGAERGWLEERAAPYLRGP